MKSSRFWNMLLVASMLLGAVYTQPPTMVAQAANDLRISQVYGGGGQSGATLTHDYIEIFNAGTSSMSLNGLSVQFADVSSYSWITAPLPDINLQPGQYFLIQGAGGGTGIQPLPTPDLISSLDLNSLIGEVALVNGTTPLADPNPSGPEVLDKVAYGDVYPDAETLPTGFLSSTAAAVRKEAGCTDTDNNAADFEVTNTLVPRNTASALHNCYVAVVSTDPPEGAIDIPLDANVNFVFNKNITTTEGAFSFACNSTPVEFSFSHTGKSVTLDPTNDFSQGEDCTVAVSASGVSGEDGALMPSDFTLNFRSFEPTPPHVKSTSPADNATNVALNTSIDIEFDEEVTVSDGWYDLSCDGSPVSSTYSESMLMDGYNITPAADLPEYAHCAVTIDPTLVLDAFSTPMEAEYSFTFATLGACPLPATSLHTISEVQGADSASPYANTKLTVRGTVTSDLQGSTKMKGFFIQTDGDGDSATSDGILVYEGNTSLLDVAVGDAVQVSGTVSEFNGMTEITTLTQLAKCGPRDAISPEIIDLPIASGTSLEPYEGMLVKIPENLTIDQNYFQGRYGQLTLSAGGRLYTPSNLDTYTPAGYADMAAANQRAMLILDDGSSTQNPNPMPYYISASSMPRAGDMTTAAGVTGVLDEGLITANSTTKYYRLHPTQTVNFTQQNPRSAAPAEVGGSLKVASFNIDNYFTTVGSRGASNATEFERQRAKTVAAIKAINADVIGLMELESSGTAAALDNLVAALNTEMGAGTYAKINDPATGYGTDEIKVGLIYKPASVEPIGASSSLVNAAFTRYPLAQTFKEVGTYNKFTVVVNHFKSKGCTDAAGLDLDQNDGQSCYNATRKTQAAALLTFIDTLKTESGDPDVLVIGDLNAYGYEDPINMLRTGGLTDEMDAIPITDRYTYVFDGMMGNLDHALSTDSLHDQVSGITVWHINADEPYVLDYNTEYRTTGAYPPDLYQPDPYRSSDHDPVILGLGLQTCYKLTTQVSPAGGGSVQVNTAPNCGTDSYHAGTVVSITAVETAGYHFVNWTGADDTTTAASTITITGDKTVTANFATSCYILTTAASPTAGGSVQVNTAQNCTGGYTYGTVVSITALPAADYHFVNWSGTDNNTPATTEITMTGNKTVTANFEINCYTLTTQVSPAGGGSVQVNTTSNCGTGGYTAGTVVSITATPATGYHFVDWTGADDAATAASTITITGDKTVTANFATNCYVLTTAASPTAGGSVQVNTAQNCTGGYTHGTVVSITALPATDYHFVNWSGTDNNTPATTEITMTGNKTATANFEINCYTLTTQASPADGGSVQVNTTSNCGTGGYTAGTVVSITATPAADRHFVNWTGADNAATAASTVTMTGDKTVTANFATNCYILTTAANPTMGGSVQVNTAQNCTGGYTPGTVVSVAAIASSGYRLVNWSGADDNTLATPTVTMTGDKTVTANFTSDCYTLAVNVNPAGAGTAAATTPQNCTGGYLYNTEVTLQATAAKNFMFLDWSGDLTSSSNPGSIKLTQNSTVQANFSSTLLPARPTLLSPLTKAELKDTTPTLTWKPAANALSYEVQISTESRFKAPTTYAVAAGLTSFELPTALPEGTYYWRVRGVNAALTGTFSSPWSLIIDTTPPTIPVLSQPADESMISDTTPRFIWQPPKGAKTYTLQVSTVEDFAGSTKEYTSKTSTFTLPNIDALPYGIYYWRVNAADTAGNVSGWSQTRMLIITILSSPANGAYITDQTPPMRWTRVTGALGYHLQIGSDENFTTIVLDATGLSARTSGLTAPSMPYAHYYWRIEYQKADTTWSGWLPMGEFTITPTIAKVSLLSPTNHAKITDTTPDFTWKPVAALGGTDIHYEIQIAADTRFATHLTTTTVTPTAYTVPDGEDLVSGRHYWRVRAVNNLGYAGAWSTAYYFTLP